MHTTLQSNDQFNQTNLFLQRLQGIYTFLGDNITIQGFTFLQAMWNKSRMDISQWGDYGWKKKLGERDE